jgi:hypothetical protein
MSGVDEAHPCRNVALIRPGPGYAPAVDDWICARAGARRVRRRVRLQSLWGGYGRIERVELDGAEVPSLILKHVTPGPGRGRSHARKLRSYSVELCWYQRWAERCDEACRVPRPIAVEATHDGWRFLLEDLDASGFAVRRARLGSHELELALGWLARFHARFLGEAPDGLWKTGTYWHLATRPDELRATRDPAIRAAAPELDARLRGARFQTLVHGDAKPANLCFRRDGAAVAAVDFQYVGGGCGVRDVAYLLHGADGWGRGGRSGDRPLELYFRALRRELAALRPEIDAEAVETEWRALEPVAVADFERFLAGWSVR